MLFFVKDEKEADAQSQNVSTRKDEAPSNVTQTPRRCEEKRVPFQKKQDLGGEHNPELGLHIFKMAFKEKQEEYIKLTGRVYEGKHEYK